MFKNSSLSAVVIVASLLACNDAVDLNERGRDAFITGHVDVDSSCRMTPELLLSGGSFDVGAENVGKGCKKAYKLNLLVDTQLRDLVLFDKAQVTLSDAAGEALDFSAQGLSNPFDVVTAGRVANDKNEGIVGTPVIPRKYADALAGQVGESIIVSVRLSGETASGDAVSTQMFRFPVDICKGCLTRCSTTIKVNEDPYADRCADNAAADGRVCIDNGC